jgi:hypothetical protein
MHRLIHVHFFERLLEVRMNEQGPAHSPHQCPIA